MTSPSIVPTKYHGDYRDYLQTKVERDGCVRMQYSTVTVPTGTVITTIVGLVPFNKGFRLSYGSKMYVENIGDGSSTIDVGYVYKTGSTGTDDPDAFGSALTTSAAGGLITFDEEEGLSWVAADDGWIAVTIGGSTTDNTGAITGQFLGLYDGLDSSN
jgi:hypothetical protein